MSRTSIAGSLPETSQCGHNTQSPTSLVIASNSISSLETHSIPLNDERTMSITNDPHSQTNERKNKRTKSKTSKFDHQQHCHRTMATALIMERAKKKREHLGDFLGSILMIIIISKTHTIFVSEDWLLHLCRSFSQLT